MQHVYFITHPEVVIDANIPVPQWPLSETGRNRMQLLVSKDWVQHISSVYSSTEQKALDGAGILAASLKLPVSQLEALGENDRSSTGYVPREVFEAMAKRFFALPNESVAGWERALDAQERIVSAVQSILDQDSTHGDIAIVSHGGVGTLLLCHLVGAPIDRSRDQPGSGGGNLFCFERDTHRLIHGWKSFEDS